MSSEDPQVEDTGSSSEDAACGIFPKETKLAMLCRLGKIVKSDTFVPQTQSFLDGVNLSQTLHKLAFDILQSLDHCSAQPSKINFPQVWLGSQLGLGLAISGTLVFAVLALLGNIFDDNDKQAVKRNIARAWPYIRNSIKIVKNNFKGFRSLFFTIGVFHPEDLTKLFLQLFCIVGILSFAIRAFNTYQIETRKNLTLNEMPALLQALSSLRDTVFAAIPQEKRLLESRLEQFAALEKTAQQKHMTNLVNRSLIATNIYCGLIDSLYQFMGLSSFIQLGLSTLFIACTVFSAVYVLLGVITRVNDELENQRRLEVQIVEAEWRVALYRLSLLKAFEPPIAPTSNDEILLQDPHEIRIQEAKQQLRRTQEKLMQLRQFSRGVAFLQGLHAGLFAYSALTTILLFAVTMAGLFAVTLPSVLIPVLMGVSLACMVVAFAYHMREQEGHRTTLIQENQEFETQFNKAMDIKEERLSLKNIKQPSRAPWVRSREFLEPIRMLFSGAKKGSGFVEFNYMDRINYDSSPVVAIIAIVSMLVHGIIFFLAGLAKHLGRDPEARNFEPELAKSQLDAPQEPETNATLEHARRNSQTEPNENMPLEQRDQEHLNDPKNADGNLPQGRASRRPRSRTMNESTTPISREPIPRLTRRPSYETGFFKSNLPVVEETGPAHLPMPISSTA